MNPRSFLTVGLTGLILIVTFLWWIGKADAQTAMVCAPKEQMITNLANRFNEHTIRTGIMQPYWLIKFLESDAGTWTVLLIRPDDIACIIAAGDSLEREQPFVAGKVM